MFNVMIQEMQISRKQIIVIDDSQANVDIAHSLGIEAIMFDGNIRELTTILLRRSSE